MSFEFYDRALAVRREHKQKIVNGEAELYIPTDDERRSMQLDQYRKSGSMGSFDTPLMRG